MTAAVFADVLVAVVAVVDGKAQSHAADPGGSVFLVARHTVASVEPFDTMGVARIGKLRFRVGVFGLS
jgi:hypothetical protein